MAYKKGIIPVNKTSRELEEKIIKEYNLGKYGCLRLARMFNLGTTTIKRILKRNNVFIIKNREFDEDWRKNISETRKRLYKEYKIEGFKKGHKSLVNWNGRHHSEESKEKIRLSHLGKKCPKLSETRKRLFIEGKLKTWNKGKETSFEHRKKSSATKQGIKLEDWKGFSHNADYDFNFINRFKRAIRKRDNYVCMLCGVHSEKLNRALSIHHINYQKKLTVPQNCISLCDVCHVKTQKNREAWTKFFQEILTKHYDYQYENGNIVFKFQQLNLQEKI